MKKKKHVLKYLNDSFLLLQIAWLVMGKVKYVFKVFVCISDYRTTKMLAGQNLFPKLGLTSQEKDFCCERKDKNICYLI